MYGGEEAIPWGEAAVGATFAGCRIERFISHGRTGAVYRARHPEFDHPVALKVIKPAIIDPVGAGNFRERFLAEAEIATRVEHPNVVPLYKAGEEGHLLYVLMRYVPGPDLRELLAAEGTLAPPRATNLVAQVAAGLDAVHGAGLVIGDLRPANVLVTEKGGEEHAQLADFGFPKQEAFMSNDQAVDLLMPEAQEESLDYMAPECVKGPEADARADVYSLACILYELLTGLAPYSPRRSLVTLIEHLEEPPPVPSSRGGMALARFDELIAQGMAKQPDARFSSAAQLGGAAVMAAGTAPSE